MLGVLTRFLEFLQIEQSKVDALNDKNTQYHKTKKDSQTMIDFDDERDNVYSQSSEIITQIENGKEVKMEIITEIVPVSKTSAIRKTTIERIR